MLQSQSAAFSNSNMLSLLAHRPTKHSRVLDSAEALERIASGGVADSDVSAMLLRQQAAKTAQDLLPAARQQLDAAHAAVAHLNNQVHTATVNFLTLEADKVAKQYLEAWHTLKRTHDSLVGISHALPPSKSWQDNIHTGVTEMEIPGFRLPALGNVYRFDHVINERTVEQAKQSWQAAVEQLSADPDATIGELFGVAA